MSVAATQKWYNLLWCWPLECNNGGIFILSETSHLLHISVFSTLGSVIYFALNILSKYLFSGIERITLHRGKLISLYVCSVRI